jgi:uncharacterized cupin superfamily protein
MQSLALEGVAMWSVWQPERKMFFNSFFLQRPEGNIVVDPLPASDDDLAFMRERGGVREIVITNRDHERKARELADVFKAQILAGENEASLLNGPVNRTIKAGDRLDEGIEVIELRGGKTRGEIALSLPGAKAAIVGDALWGDPAGSLRLPPDDKLIDPAQAVLSLRQIWALRLKVLLVGDGACIFGGADDIIGRCLQARGIFVNRINVDEAPGTHFSHAGGKYESTVQELGLLIGARKLGYHIATIPPGKRFCPLHAEDHEEEFFIVWEGEAVVRTLRGELTCRPGDIIAFQPGDVGAHQVINRSDKPCRVFMLGMEGLGSVAFYPDSNKVLITTRDRLMLRAAPNLDYYDGE